MIHMMVDTGWRKAVTKEALKSLIEVQMAAEKNQYQ